jgi:hypothetical protein
MLNGGEASKRGQKSARFSLTLNVLEALNKQTGAKKVTGSSLAPHIRIRSGADVYINTP